MPHGMPQCLGKGPVTVVIIEIVIFMEIIGYINIRVPVPIDIADSHP